MLCVCCEWLRVTVPGTWHLIGHFNINQRYGTGNSIIQKSEKCSWYSRGPTEISILISLKNKCCTVLSYAFLEVGGVELPCWSLAAVTSWDCRSFADVGQWLSLRYYFPPLKNVFCLSLQGQKGKKGQQGQKGTKGPEVTDLLSSITNNTFCKQITCVW